MAADVPTGEGSGGRPTGRTPRGGPVRWSRLGARRAAALVRLGRGGRGSLGLRHAAALVRLGRGGRGSLGLRHAAALAREGPALLALVPLWAWWAVHRGGGPPTVWIPGLAAMAALLAILVRVPRPPLAGPRRLALLALLGLAAWATASVAWAADRGAAPAACGRLWLVALAAALPLVWPPSARALRMAVGAWAGCAAAAAVAGLLGARAADGLIDGRVMGTTGYVNASAALLVMGALPALVLAARPGGGARERAAGGVAAAARPLALGAAGGLAGAALLAQSRGAALAVVAGGAAALALTPYRGRLLAAAAAVAVSCVAVAPVLLDVRRAALNGSAGGALRTAGIALAVQVAALVVVGSLAGRAKRPAWTRGPRAARAARVLAVAGVAAASMGGVAALVVHGGPAAVLERAAADARTPDYGQIESGGNRFEGGLGSYRSDYWRVAVDVTAARPLAGVGAGNFAAAYLERRHTPKAPLHAHTLWLGVAAGLGLPGLALLLVAAGALAFAVVRACREAPPAERAVRAAAALPAVTLAVHASADWSSAYPGLTVPAIALAAAAAAPARRREVGPRREAPASPAGPREVGAGAPAPPSPARLRERWVGAEDGAWAAAPERRAGAEDGAGVGAPQGRAGAEDGGWVGAPEHRAGGRGVIALASLAVVVALAFAPVYLGARWTDRALADWRERPDAAIASLHRAASIDRLDPRPPLLEGVLSLQLGRAGDARAAFLRAAGRDRSAWYPRYALGLLAARTDRTEALRWLALAARRNPRSPDVRAARTAVARGVALDPRAAQQRALSRPG